MHVDFILIDVDPWNEIQALQFAKHRQANCDSTLIACTGFPRSHLQAVLRDAGADQVWFKLESLGGLAKLMATGAQGA